MLEFRERPAPPPSHHDESESMLCASDEDDTWAVYRDQLEERGDPLATWLAEASWADDDARRRQLLGLAESVRGHLADVTWSPRGMLSSLTLSRQAVTGAPGLAWHLTQLSRLPVARLLPRLAIALFAGPAASRAMGSQDPDTLAALTLERLAQLEGAPALRSLSLGFVSEPRQWPRAEAAWQRLRERARRLDADWHGVVSAGRAALAPGDVVEPVEGLRFLFSFAGT